MLVEGIALNGTLTYPNGSSNVGEIKDFSPHGKGKLYFHKEKYEEGVFDEGVLVSGVLKDGATDREGHFIDGELEG